MDNFVSNVRLAAVQASPILFDKNATVDKACRLIKEAGQNGAQVIGFPETFISGYPSWANWYNPSSPEAIRFSRALIKSAVEVPSSATEALCAAARKAGAYVVMGINERDPGRMGSIYNSLLFISPEGEVLGVHRKLVPTSIERLIHWFGDGSSLRVYDTPLGGLGGLICGENTNSLARWALLAQNEYVHVASWPSFCMPFHRTSSEGIDIRVRNHAFEGRIFVISAASVLSDQNIEAFELDEEQKATIVFRGGGSGIVNPSGQYIAGPVDDTEQIVYADANMDEIIDGKIIHDITGHYNRLDLFTLLIKKQTREPLRVESGTNKRSDVVESMDGSLGQGVQVAVPVEDSDDR